MIFLQINEYNTCRIIVKSVISRIDYNHNIYLRNVKFETLAEVYSPFPKHVYRLLRHLLLISWLATSGTYFNSFWFCFEIVIKRYKRFFWRHTTPSFKLLLKDVVMNPIFVKSSWSTLMWNEKCSIFWGIGFAESIRPLNLSDM